ncbi:hypothetical protein EDC55_10351 [Allofrancisella inopinata]|uniref:Uncharacterized protein n=1 Tax=Allofrancisella inopinata TaxID=1085647 RepID=A0AAE6YIV4_9GAMM|nr:hypothetical protein [Allofrancisella inopinata]QIV96725.1 hypothetical protein E4K63_07740 [Allofrancisella inopinata]TDT73482.1 hypothetical protein EDC55_10351 [Allofrancisella inopinata]
MAYYIINFDKSKWFEMVSDSDKRNVANKWSLGYVWEHDRGLTDLNPVMKGKVLSNLNDIQFARDHHMLSRNLRKHKLSKHFDGWVKNFGTQPLEDFNAYHYFVNTDNTTDYKMLKLSENKFFRSEDENALVSAFRNKPEYDKYKIELDKLNMENNVKVKLPRMFDRSKDTLVFLAHGSYGSETISSGINKLDFSNKEKRIEFNARIMGQFIDVFFKENLYPGINTQHDFSTTKGDQNTLKVILWSCYAGGISESGKCIAGELCKKLSEKNKFNVRVIAHDLALFFPDIRYYTFPSYPNKSFFILENANHVWFKTGVNGEESIDLAHNIYKYGGKNENHKLIFWPHKIRGNGCMAKDKPSFKHTYKKFNDWQPKQYD